MTNLKELNLFGNGLSGKSVYVQTYTKRSQSRKFPRTFPLHPGAIPPELGRLTNLTQLILSGNALSGTFADSLPICVCPDIHKSSRAHAQAPSRSPSATSRTCRDLSCGTISWRVRAVLNQFNTKTHEPMRRRHPGVHRQPHEPANALPQRQQVGWCVC